MPNEQLTHDDIKLYFEIGNNQVVKLDKDIQKDEFELFSHRKDSQNFLNLYINHYNQHVNLFYNNLLIAGGQASKKQKFFFFLNSVTVIR